MEACPSTPPHKNKNKSKKVASTPSLPPPYQRSATFRDPNHTQGGVDLSRAGCAACLVQPEGHLRRESRQGRQGAQGMGRKPEGRRPRAGVPLEGRRTGAAAAVYMLACRVWRVWKGEACLSWLLPLDLPARFLDASLLPPHTLAQLDRVDLLLGKFLERNRYNKAHVDAAVGEIRRRMALLRRDAPVCLAGALAFVRIHLAELSREPASSPANAAADAAGRPQDIKDFNYLLEDLRDRFEAPSFPPRTLPR